LTWLENPWLSKTMMGPMKYYNASEVISGVDAVMMLQTLCFEGGAFR